MLSSLRPLPPSALPSELSNSPGVFVDGADVRMDVIYVVIRGAGDATTHPMPYVQTCSKQALETHVQTLYHQKRVTICDNKLNS